LVHDFPEGLEFEREASPILSRWYRLTFKNLIAVVDVTSELFYQNAGIDKFLVFRCPDIPRIISFSIDEKARGQSWNDILAEIWSKREKEIPGWVWTCKADYIVYAFIVDGELAEPPRFIPTVDLVSAVKAKDYPLNEAKNLGWTTVFKLIPKEELPSKPPREIRLEDFI